MVDTNCHDRKKDNQRDSKGSEDLVKNSLAIKKSLDSLVNKSLTRAERHQSLNNDKIKPRQMGESSQRTTCIFPPETVELQSPDVNHVSIDSPKAMALLGDATKFIDIFVDKDSPVLVKTDSPRVNSVAVSNDQSMSLSPNRDSYRQSKRNYFRGDQRNKAILNSIANKTQNSDEQINQVDDLRATKHENISRHDQTLGGQNQHNGDQHDQSRRREQVGEEESTVDWHDVKIFKAIDGDSKEKHRQQEDEDVDNDQDEDDGELVIENLENLQDSTALIVTREGSRFKIGISQKQDINASEMISQIHSAQNKERIPSLKKAQITVTSKGGVQQKVKLRGKFSSRATIQHSQDQSRATILPKATSQYSHNRYHSIQTNQHQNQHPQKLQLEQPFVQTLTAAKTQYRQLNNSVEFTNKYKTFQDPIQRTTITNQQQQEDDGQEQLEASRFMDGNPQQRLLPSQEVLLDRSHIQRAQAEQIIQQNRQQHIYNQKVPITKTSGQSTKRQHNQYLHQASSYIDEPHSRRSRKASQSFTIENKNQLNKVQKINDPHDRSDCKFGPTVFNSNRFRKQSDDKSSQQQYIITSTAVPQYLKSTDKANSSVHSRQDYYQPTANQQLALNTQLQDIPDQQNNFQQSMTQAKRRVQQDFRINGRPYAQNLSLTTIKHDQRRGGPEFAQRLKQPLQYGLFATPQQVQTNNVPFLNVRDDYLLGDALNSSSADEDVAHQSYLRSRISRRSNADQKGENLVKVLKYSATEAVKDEEDGDVNLQSPRNDNDIPNQQLINSPKDNQDDEYSKKAGLNQQPYTSQKQAFQETGQVRALNQILNNSISARTQPAVATHAFNAATARRVSMKKTSPERTSPSASVAARTEKAALQQSNHQRITTPIKQLSEKHPSSNVINQENDTYFPQILNGDTENDVHKNQNLVQAKPKTKSSSTKTKNVSNRKVQEPSQNHIQDSQKRRREPISIIHQNVARVEKKNPSTVASILSHSVLGEQDAEVEASDDRHRASTSLENVSEEKDRISSMLKQRSNNKNKQNLDGADANNDQYSSSYNFQPNEMAAAPNENQLHYHTVPKLDTEKLLKMQAAAGADYTGNSDGEVASASPIKSRTSNLQKSQKSKQLSQSKNDQDYIQNQSKQQQLQQSISQSKRSGLPSSTLSKRNQQLSATADEHQHQSPNEDSIKTQHMSPELETRQDADAGKAAIDTAYVREAQVIVNPPKNKSSTLQEEVNTELPKQIHDDPKKTEEEVSLRGNNNTILSTSNRQSVRNRSMRSSPPQQQYAIPNKHLQPEPVSLKVDNMLENLAQQPPALISESSKQKPIMKYASQPRQVEQKSYPLKYFKGQELELYYMEKQLKPEVEREIKEGFFEIRKKFGGDDIDIIDGEQQTTAEQRNEEVQVYVSHLCLHNYHPIFCKFNLDVVKTILNFSQIVYLKKDQVLYEKGFNDRYLYVILFGKVRLSQHDSDEPVGMPLNIGWTVGEEILFKSDRTAKNPKGERIERCRSQCESCVLGIQKKGLAQIKRTLVERGQTEEFVKLEVVLRGNYLVKKSWRTTPQQ